MSCIAKGALSPVWTEGLDKNEMCAKMTVSIEKKTP